MATIALHYVTLGNEYKVTNQSINQLINRFYLKTKVTTVCNNYDFQLLYYHFSICSLLVELVYILL